MFEGLLILQKNLEVLWVCSSEDLMFEDLLILIDKSFWLPFTKIDYFRRFVEIVGILFLDDRLCIVDLRRIKFLLNITQIYTTYYWFTLVVSLSKSYIGALNR